MQLKFLGENESSKKMLGARSASATPVEVFLHVEIELGYISEPSNGLPGILLPLPGLAI